MTNFAETNCNHKSLFQPTERLPMTLNFIQIVKINIELNIVIVHFYVNIISIVSDIQGRIKQH